MKFMKELFSGIGHNRVRSLLKENRLNINVLAGVGIVVQLLWVKLLLGVPTSHTGVLVWVLATLASDSASRECFQQLKHQQEEQTKNMKQFYKHYILKYLKNSEHNEMNG